MRVSFPNSTQLLTRQVGAFRGVASKGLARPDGTVPTQDEDGEGAAAECAVAQALNIYWPASVNAFDEPDLYHPVFGPIHVRHSVERNRCLIVRERDFRRDGEEDIFAFVTGCRGEYDIRGWIRLGECRRDEWLRDPHGLGKAWFVPVSALGPIDQLLHSEALA